MTRSQFGDDSLAVWRKSSKCSAGACVEVTLSSTSAGIRDGKANGDPFQPVVRIDLETWRAFTHQVETGASNFATGELRVTRVAQGETVVSSGDVHLRYDDAEWVAFVAGVAAGEFRSKGLVV